MSFLVNENLSSMTVGQLLQQMSEAGAASITISQDYANGKKCWLLVVAHNETADRIGDCLKQIDAEDLAAEVEEG